MTPKQEAWTIYEEALRCVGLPVGDPQRLTQARMAEISAATFAARYAAEDGASE